MPGGPGAKRAKKGGVTSVKMEHIPGYYQWHIEDYERWITMYIFATVLENL